MTSEEYEKMVEELSSYLIRFMKVECDTRGAHNDVSFLSVLTDSLDEVRGEVEVWLDRAMHGTVVGPSGG